MPNFEAHNGGNILKVKRWCRKNKNVLILMVGVVGITASAIKYYKWVSYKSAPTQDPADVTFGESDVASPSISQDVVLGETSSEVQYHGVPPSSRSLDINEKDRINLNDLFQSPNKENWRVVLEEETSTLIFHLEKHKSHEPTQYISTTLYKNIGDIEKVRDFMIDYAFKKQFDETYEDIYKTHVDNEHKIVYYHVIRCYPIIGFREYFTASKLWQKQDGSEFFCVTKACKKYMNKQPKHTVVDNYLQGWRIIKGPVPNSCEVKLFQQEDMKTILSSFQDRFKGKIWDYVQETERKLLKYIKDNRKPPSGILDLIESF